MNDKLFATVKNVGKFMLPKSSFKVKNPQMYLEYFQNAIDDVGPIGFKFEVKPVGDTYECEWVSPEKDVLLDWEQNRRIYYMVRGIRVRDKKINALLAEIQSSFFFKEDAAIEQFLFNGYKEYFPEINEDGKQMKYIPVTDENRAGLERLRVIFEKFKIKLAFDKSADGLNYLFKMDLKEAVILDGNHPVKGLDFSCFNVDGMGEIFVTESAD